MAAIGVVVAIVALVLITGQHKIEAAIAFDDVQQAEASIQLPTECPEHYGLQLYPHPTHCDHYIKCTNGTLSHETCPNGLLFDGLGSIEQHCNYDWAVNCGHRKERAPPISTEHCPYLWGIYSISAACETNYFKCADGIAYVTPCEPGLVYDERTHTCNWPDLLKTCNSDQVVGFTCPDHVTGLSARFIPTPRFAAPYDCSRYIVCVDYKPRLIGCGDGSAFDEATLTCVDIKEKPGCKPTKY